MLSINGHKTGLQKDNVTNIKKRKYINPHYIPQKQKTPSIKNVLC